MPVDKFGHTDSGSTQRVISGGVTLSQVNNIFLRRDGTNTVTDDLNMSGKLVKGLPTTYPPLYVGNEAVSWAQVVGLVNNATTNNDTTPTGDYNLTNRKYVDARDALKVAKAGDTMEGNLDMNNFKIGNVPIPANSNDAANKRYVDQRYDLFYDSLTGLLKKMLVPSSVGLIPILTEKNDKSGYVVEESSKLNDNHGYNAFRLGRGWRVANDVTINFWLKIKLPRQERVYRISIKAVDDTKIKKWELQGRNIDDDYHPWIVIPFTNEDDLVIQRSTRIFEAQLRDTDDYRFYRLYVYESDGRNPGLSHLQFYTLNKILYDI